MIYSKFIYNQNWNIGFTKDTEESFLKKQALGKVQWMQHKYKDRFFADPFVLKTTNDTIVLLAEELIFSEVKGRIVRLVVDKQTKKISTRKVILDLDFHLSYPAIIQHGGQVFIYPENSKSGALNIYKYDDITHNITFHNTLINEALTDGTITKYNGRFWLIASKQPCSQEYAYLYVSDSFDKGFTKISDSPIVSDKRHARPAGNFFYYGNSVYRPAQICNKRYGEGISIQKIDLLSENSYLEKTMFRVYPNSFKYNLGLHTINFHEEGAVIDGCGYLYPLIGRALNLFRAAKNKFF